MPVAPGGWPTALIKTPLEVIAGFV